MTTYLVHALLLLQAVPQVHFSNSSKKLNAWVYATHS